MGKQMEDSFDPKTFLAKVGAGKTILEFTRTKAFSRKVTSPTRYSTFKKAASSSLFCPSKARKQWSRF
jgi:hypothetical protein